MNKEDLIACVSESIKQGLSIMDEKFQRLEVLASDSEDEGEVPTPRFIKFYIYIIPYSIE